MDRSDHPTIAALLAPLLLVLAYAAFVAALPSASAGDIWALASGHLVRNLIVLGSVALIAAAVMGGSALAREERRRAIVADYRAFASGPAAPRRWCALLVPHLYLALLLAAFSTFKQRALPSAGFGLDVAFADADRMLFLGMDPWRLTHALVPGATGTWILDLAYLLWFLPMILIVLLSWLAPPRLQTRYLLAFALVWIVAGSLLAFLLPGGGPCYFEPIHGDPRFAELIARLDAQSRTLEAGSLGGLKALVGQEGLWSAFESRTFILAGGISAMPSLHVALATLFACAGFACHRAAGRALAGFALLIWFGSIHLGWHYAVDGLAGGAIAILLWKLAGLWTAQLYRTRPQPVPASA